MHSLLFRYLDWNQSWMRQTVEVYDIQIDLNLKWLWPFRLINAFPAYLHFLLKHSLSKLSSLIKLGLNIFNIFRDHRVTSKIPQYFENLDPPLICFQYKREKGRDLTQSYDKSPYTNRNVKRAKWQHKQRHKKVRLNSGCGPT